MGYEVPDGFANCTLKIRNSDGHLCLISWGAVAQSTDTGQSIANALDSNLGSEIVAFLNTSCFYEGWHVFCNTAGEPTDGDVLLHLAGTFSATVAPPQVQYLFRKQTSLAGRNHRGRMYWPGASTNSISGGGDINSTELARLGTFADEFLGDFATATHSALPVILHAEGSTTPPTEILNLQAEQAVATQRRRLVR